MINLYVCLERADYMNRYNDEFFQIIQPIMENSHFKKLDTIRHHGITRLDHCVRVAYYSYFVTKLLRLNYVDVTIAALLHDFFIDEVKDKNIVQRLVKHPMFAYKNASKYYILSDMQKDIILTHMFPIVPKPPRYLESWIVDLVDDFAAIYEKIYSLRKEMRAATTFLFLLLINSARFMK